MNYVLILAGPIDVALAAFSTYASMVRTGAVLPCAACEPLPPKHSIGMASSQMLHIAPALQKLCNNARYSNDQCGAQTVSRAFGASGRATS